ncbi:beta-glucosidase [Spongiibacter sp. UBA1325]|uniref:beta-glucosidase n=1 Tax=Spongiibacter sp. UBA1325 TaxID=1947543 RepID=UPI0025803090|nr:glycoside hydrolase family 3 C-terminal domain-containing protein [Spongiibacter sp. UBA1325]
MKYSVSRKCGFPVNGLVILAAMSALLVACGGSSSPSETTTPDPISQHCGELSERPWCDASLSAAQRAELLVSAMSLEQKIDYLAGDDPQASASGDPYVGIVNGIDALGIPPLRMSDGPVGVRGSPATAMPIPLALAASFNPALAHETGAAIANEVRNKGNDLVHAPVADLVRNPLAGRSFETFGEDPLLATRMVVEWVKGSQAEGVMANIKHYLMNTQEGIVSVPPVAAVVGGRSVVNAVVDERSMRELYMPPYEAAVKEANVASVMCAYNYVNGAPACSSEYLLKSVLRDEWGFDGFLVTDYFFAQKDTVQTANASPMIEMPYGVFFSQPLLQAAVQSGAVPEQVLNDNLTQIFRRLFSVGFFDRARYQRNDDNIDQAAHAVLAQDVAEQGAVLLRNEGVLPLNDDVRRIAVIGASAQTRPSGGGSSFVTPFRFKTPLEALTERAGDDVAVSYYDGSDIAAAVSGAAEADVALVFASNLATEGSDRFCLALDCTLADAPDSLLLNNLQGGAPTLLDQLTDPVFASSPIREVLDQLFAPLLLGAPLLPVSHDNQDALISVVAAANSDSVVVLQNSGAVLTPWREQVNALLQVWYPGQEGGSAIARLLFGDTDPGGRLPLSFPEEELDNPVAGDPRRYPGLANQAEHSEGVFIGYRWFDQQSREPAYPFGYGLSYSEYSLTDLRVIRDEGGVVVTARASNIGDRAGWVVPQLYVGLPSPAAGIEQPPWALKGFSKHWLAPGESASLRYQLSSRDLSYWDDSAKDWAMAAGDYQFALGWSSRDRVMQQQLSLGGL